MVVVRGVVYVSSAEQNENRDCDTIIEVADATRSDVAVTVGVVELGLMLELKLPTDMVLDGLERAIEVVFDGVMLGVMLSGVVGGTVLEVLFDGLMLGVTLSGVVGGIILEVVFNMLLEGTNEDEKAVLLGVMMGVTLGGVVKTWALDVVLDEVDAGGAIRALAAVELEVNRGGTVLELLIEDELNEGVEPVLKLLFDDVREMLLVDGVLDGD